MGKKLLNLTNRQRLILAVSFAATVFIALLVYITGGTPSVYANLMYVIIALVSASFGKRLGMIQAIFGGLLIGPLVNYMLHENTFYGGISNNWILRLFIFAVIALIIGHFSDSSRKNNHFITNLLTHDNITNLKNLEAIKREDVKDPAQRTIVVVSVKNYEETLSFFGYTFGNQIVTNFADKLKEALSKFENTEIYRYAGMEFVIRIRDSAGGASVDDVINSINELDESILLVRSIPIYIELEIGIAKHDEATPILETVRKALIALRYASVNELKSNIFDSHLEGHYKSVVDVASSFSSALSNRDIQSAYQYIYSAASDQVQGAELLARWLKSDDTSIYPNTFVPIIEKTELIHELTSFMTDEAIFFLQTQEPENFSASINFSAKDFTDKNIHNFLRKIDASGIAPGKFQIEITERILVKVDDILRYLTLLNEHGVTIAVDDFGTGYSSYQYVAEMPIDLIKIDKSIIMKIGSSNVYKSLVKSIVSFCRENQITTLAEGVETLEVANACKKIGVDLLQGYYYHKPQMTRKRHAECVCPEEPSLKR